MRKLFISFITMCSFAVFPAIVFAAPDLTGVASVNVTSDTAMNAKTMAFNEARRQITTDVLSKYSDPQKLDELIKNTDDSTITNLIASTSIDSERLSATTYSANIKMTIDPVEAKKWFTENNIQNWLDVGESESIDKITVVIEIPDGLHDWINLNHAIQSENTDFEIKRISGNQVTITIPVTKRSEFIKAVQNSGWKSSDTDGFLKIWK